VAAGGVVLHDFVEARRQFAEPMVCAHAAKCRFVESCADFRRALFRQRRGFNLNNLPCGADGVESKVGS
jgi:hypothetical protein